MFDKLFTGTLQQVAIEAFRQKEKGEKLDMLYHHLSKNTLGGWDEHSLNMQAALKAMVKAGFNADNLIDAETAGVKIIHGDGLRPDWSTNWRPDDWTGDNEDTGGSIG